MQMLHLKLLSVECMSQPNNQNETDTRLLAGQIFGDGAFTRAPCGPFLQAHPRVSLAHFKGGSARKHGHGENKGAKGTEDWADQSNKAAASTVFITRARRISWWNSWPSLLNIFHAIQNRKCLNSVFGVVIYIYICSPPPPKPTFSHCDEGDRATETCACNFTCWKYSSDGSAQARVIFAKGWLIE